MITLLNGRTPAPGAGPLLSPGLLGRGPGLFSALPWVGSAKCERSITFAPASADDTRLPTQQANALFGISFGLGGLYHNSARFGWQWSQQHECIELLACVYYEGYHVHDMDLRLPVVARIKPGQRVKCRLEYTGSRFAFVVLDDANQHLNRLELPAPKDLPAFGMRTGLCKGGLEFGPSPVPAAGGRLALPRPRLGRVMSGHRLLEPAHL